MSTEKFELRHGINMASSPCGHLEHVTPMPKDHPLFKKKVAESAQITDIKKSHPLSKIIKEYTGWIEFGYDAKTKSLDIYFKRGLVEWDYGDGIQINNLSESDKEALKQYLENGK